MSAERDLHRKARVLEAMAKTTSTVSWTTRAKVVAVAIIILAAAVRLWGLGEQSVWQDEAYSVVLAREDVGTIIRAQVEDSSPPLYYVLLHFWLRL